MKIFLSGGGSAIQSHELDAIFFDEIEEKKLIYIPIAMESARYLGCRDWFSEVCSRHKRTEFEMVTDTRTSLKAECAFYLGGGDTIELARKLENTPLLASVLDGAFVYGGSAGAIFLGKTLRACPEGIRVFNIQGLGLLGDLSVTCHFRSNECGLTDEVLSQLSKEIGTVLALTEGSGVVIDSKKIIIESKGTKNIYLITGASIVEVRKDNSSTGIGIVGELRRARQ